jgi:hypothetical protein
VSFSKEFLAESVDVIVALDPDRIWDVAPFLT